ncbi:MAG: nucleotidyltransferase family protein [Bacillota bacterium]|nr:nucleotidyltransferase family protein [Bacillota bacterium]
MKQNAGYEMKVCGIIAEYDPFHKGHRYHLETAREKSGADYIVCVLGCAFSQRGDAMLFDSHKRAEMALLNGADLVLGMPVSFSCAQANRFAKGGVGILSGIGVTTHLSFGSERAETEPLLAAAHLLNHPNEGYNTELKNNLTAGLSFAQAQGEALAESLPQIDPELFSSPNFILGVSYLRELEARGSDIIPLPVLRKTAYHSKALGPDASAGAVRLKLLGEIICDLKEECTDESIRVILSAVMHRPEALDKALLYMLNSATPEQLKQYSEFSEGLEQRVLSAARKAVSREELILHTKTKRYPYTRISRALTQALLDMKQYSEWPEYARLLGMRKSAAPLLSAIDQSGFPLISRPARSSITEVAQDMQAEEIWQIGAGRSAQTAWQEQVVIVE